MELNAEQVKKALDWLDSLVGNSNNSDIAHFTYSLLGILYDTCEELTEENKRLKNRITCKVVLPNEKLEEIKNECLERIELDIKKIKADTVQEYREGLHKEFASLGAKDKFNKEFFLTKADQIAKEMLEGNNDQETDEK